MSNSEQQSYSVTGMSCEHCVAAVSAQVSELAGVTGVDVDLASGVVVVRGSGVDDEAVLVAVQSAGYGLAGHP
jgi:copper chaperone